MKEDEGNVVWRDLEETPINADVKIKPSFTSLQWVWQSTRSTQWTN